jgi:hypothetical protein
MLTIDTLNGIEALICSDSLTIKGTQLNSMFGLLQQIAQEKQRLLQSSRLTPMPPSDSPPKITGG